MSKKKLFNVNAAFGSLGIEAPSSAEMLCLKMSGEVLLDEESQVPELTWASRYEDHVYDLASLTKVMLTSTLLVDQLLKQQNSLTGPLLNSEVLRWIPEFRDTPYEKKTLREVWEHRAGLTAHFFANNPSRKALEVRSRDEMWSKLLKRAATFKPLTETTYSDLSFWTLGCILERWTQRSLSDLWRGWRKDHGISLETLNYFPMGGGVPSFEKRQVMPTELNRHPVGQVNDDNASSMGGEAPHAGLFGSATDVWQWLEKVHGWAARDPRVLSWFQVPTSHTNRFYLGWDTPSGSAQSQAGGLAPKGTVGHLGFTGTALWWNPQSLEAAVLLTNRVYPEHGPMSHAMIRKLRTRFFDEFWERNTAVNMILT